MCTRELQKSIKDSVHKLLIDIIEMYGLQGNFDYSDHYLKSKIGGEFIYSGLRHNVNQIKSMEGIDICWIEEAQTVSKDSLRIVYPTIRKPGSEIWQTFNPDLEEDPIYQEVVENPRPNAISRKVNFTENNWFSEESRLEM